MKRALCAMALLLVPVWAMADVTSGPKAGEKVEDFKVNGVVGIIDNKEGSYVKERKDEPTVYLFVQHEHFGRPMFQFIKGLDGKSKEANDKAAVMCVFLTEKQDMVKDYLPKLNMSGQFANTSLGVFPGEKSGPNNWGINVDAHITAVVVHKGKVVTSLAFQSVNATDVAKVEEVLKKLK